MIIKRITIENFRGIDSLAIPFNKNINVFIGENGMGKSSILDALSTLLTWLIVPLQTSERRGKTISLRDQKKGTSFTKLSIELYDYTFPTHSVFWECGESDLFSAMSITQRKNKRLNLYDYVHFLKNNYKDHNKSMPLIMYYQITRGGKSSSEKNRLLPSRTKNPIGIYDHALEGDIHFQSFIDWLREQNELKNHIMFSNRENWLFANDTYYRELTKDFIHTIRIYKKQHGLELSLFEESLFRKLLSNYNSEKLFSDPRIFLHEFFSICFKEGLLVAPESFNKIDDNIKLFVFNLADISMVRSKSVFGDGFYASVFKRLFKTLYNDLQSVGIALSEQKIIWVFLDFSIQICLWWTSPSCRKKIHGLMMSQLKSLAFPITLNTVSQEIYDIILEDIIAKKNVEGKELTTLAVVNKALSSILQEYSNLRVDLSTDRYIGRGIFNVLIDKDGETLSLDQLSTGEQTLIALVGDIARRLVMANPKLENPLDGSGVVLIDEMDLHLHPKWQKSIVKLLTKTFPYCQFIITTHSPLILSRLNPENIFILAFGENKRIEVSNPPYSKGLSVNDILEGIMNEEAYKDEDAAKMLKQINDALDDENTKLAKKILKKLGNYLGDRKIPEMFEQETYLSFIEQRKLKE